ncbi:MAG TPA: SpoIIE family protein phosphatase [Acidobacteriaceae bacterium]|nr:SpoIIE family protein phosphatase [Acidobacteriaceae bacterium]
MVSLVRRGLRSCSVLFVVLAALAPLMPGEAQTLKLSNPGTGSVPLDKDWRFHLGDNPTWADPTLDDSNWESIKIDEPWGQQSHPSYTGFAWYRLKLDIDNSNSAGTKNLALLIPSAQDTYEIFWNGQKLGTYGSLPPHAEWWITGHAAVYPLPGTSGVMALRVWKAPLSSVDPAEVGGFSDSPLLGDAALLTTKAQSDAYIRDERRLPGSLMAAVNLVIGVLSFLMYLRDRRQSLYLWLAIYLVAGGLQGFQQLAVFRAAMNWHTYQLLTQLLASAQDISMWLILLALFGMAQERRWRRATGWIIALYLAAQIIDITSIFLWERGGILPWIDAITTGVYSLTPLYVFVIIGVGLTRRNRPSLWPLIIAACLTGLFSCVLNLTVQGVRFTHWTTAARLLRLSVHVGGYSFDMFFLLSTFLFLALIFTVAREQFLERERQAKIELEIKSAQEVQRILVPEETPAIPGLSIASLYRPAEEVGGDFFQVIATDRGSALIALGDVSGKGLKAAMTVSLIVGTLRTLVDYTQSPGEILRGLNRRLLGRTDGGFVTCLIARIDSDGETTMANAGHLAPFRDRDELPVAGSLPLGLSASADYIELVFTLHEGEMLTFYTDGILEARNAAGELYGFERLTALIRSQPTVEQMVEEARTFGQQDDITVFQVTRLAHSAPAHAARLSLETQIAGA